MSEKELETYEEYLCWLGNEKIKRESKLKELEDNSKSEFSKKLMKDDIEMINNIMDFVEYFGKGSF